jgi:type IVB pilus formation R64 PilN family outer membrane protein
MSWRYARLAMTSILTALTLSGCAIHQRLSQRDADVAHTRQTLARTQTSFEARTNSRTEKLKAQQVEKPWLVSRAVPLSRDVTLPAALRAKVNTTMLYRGGKTDLVVLAERITQATGVPVQIKPEALLPAESFLPRLSVSAMTPVAIMPHQVLLEMGAQPLPKILDQISKRLNLCWRFFNGAIEFYRTQTQVFDVRALTLSAQAEARLGRRANTKAGGFDSTSSTSLKSTEQHALEAIKLRLEPFLTRAGVVAAQPGALSSLIVTDTPEALQAIGRLIERENRTLTRRVRLIFEEISLQTHEDLEFGLDWDALFAKGSFAAALSAPVAGAGVGVARAALDAAHGPIQSSKLIVNALAKFGTVVRHVSMPVLTLNKRPVTHAIRTTFSYIDQVKTSAQGATGVLGAATGMPSMSVSQKEETVGSFLTLVPDAQDDGQILLSVAYDNTVAQPLKTLTIGEQSSRMQIQQITIDGNGTVQQVALRPGQPMLVSGFEQKHGEADRARLSADASIAFGGSDRVRHNRMITLIVITAQVEEGF